MNFTDFKEKLFADKEFAKKFANVKTPAELIKIAAAEGYVFTEDDIMKNTELTPEEMEKAAGGGFISSGSGWIDFSTSIVKTNFYN